MNRCYLELKSQREINLLGFGKDIPQFIENFTDFYDERNNLVKKGYGVIIHRSNGKYIFYRAKSLPDNCVSYLEFIKEILNV